MENHEHHEYLVEPPRYMHRDNFTRIRPPKAVRSRERNRKQSSPGSIRQRRNRHWNW